MAIVPFIGTNCSYDFYSYDFMSTNVDCIFACATDDPVRSINTSDQDVWIIAIRNDSKGLRYTGEVLLVGNKITYLRDIQV